MSKARTKKLFQRMMLSYGNAFSRQYPNGKLVDAAIDEWAEQLEPYTDAEIDEAYDRAIKERTWPPNLPEFLQIVKTAHQRKGKPNLPELTPCDPAVAASYIDELRRILSRKNIKHR